MPPVERPAVVAWQHRYCAFMCCAYVLTVAMGVFMIAFRREGADGRNSAEDLLVMGVLLVGMGLVLAVAYGIAPFLEPAPWLWVYHLVLIAFTLTSPCCLPTGVPLLIFWIKPETKAWFGQR